MMNEGKCEKTPIFSNILELISCIGFAEKNLKKAKANYEKEYNQFLLYTDWNLINEDRKKQNLPKLSNQDMKNAYINEKLKSQKQFLLECEMIFNDLKRKYDVALKYSFEVIR